MRLTSKLGNFFHRSTESRLTNKTGKEESTDIPSQVKDRFDFKKVAGTISLAVGIGGLATFALLGLGSQTAAIAAIAAIGGVMGASAAFLDGGIGASGANVGQTLGNSTIYGDGSSHQNTPGVYVSSNGTYGVQTPYGTYNSDGTTEYRIGPGVSLKL